MRRDSAASLHSDSVREVKAASLMLASVPILDTGIDSASAVQGWLTDIPASSTAAIGSDLFSHGRKVGTTRISFTSISLMADITCSTRIIPAFALLFASCFRTGTGHKCSGLTGLGPTGERLLLPLC